MGWWGGKEEPECFQEDGFKKEEIWELKIWKHSYKIIHTPVHFGMTLCFKNASETSYAV